VAAGLVENAWMTQEQFSTHGEPVWRDRANFIVNATLPEAGRFEQLWCRQITDHTFEVCCIPFFLYDVALGDVVETSPQGERRYVLSRVRTRSGRYVFRAFFERRQYRFRDEAVGALTSLGALVEWSSPSLVAVDARDAAHGQEIADCLHAQQLQDHLVYETGKTA
jgi:hypothetical protein